MGERGELAASGVLMNGNGYCLQAGPPLAIGFDGQCDGQAGQLWAYRATTGQLMSVGHGNCAVLGGPLVPGTPVVSGACAGGTRWSLGSGVIPVQPAVSARPQATPGRVVVQPAAAPAAGSAAGAGAGAAAGGGLLLAALLAGLLLMTGATLVFFGRRSRTARRDRPTARPALGRPALGRAADTPDDDGPYVVDVTDEVARRQRAQEVVESRPTEPFDVSALP